jgi:hypothetical protein
MSGSMEAQMHGILAAVDREPGDIRACSVS